MNTKQDISFFEKFLSLWVIICMGIGVLIGRFIPSIPNFIKIFDFYNVNIIIAFLIWFMIFPMMMKINFSSVKKIGKSPKGLFLTWFINWVVKPFSMFAIAYLFFMVLYKNIMPNVNKDYLAGAILLGVAPCTAMVFVWSTMTKGNASYTLIQVATNDLIILILFVPISSLLLGVSGFNIPWATLFISLLLFVVLPMILGIIFRTIIIKKKDVEFLNKKVIPKFNNLTIVGLLLTLIIIFSLQADLIIQNPLHIILISIPLIIQTFFIFFTTYFSGKLLKLPHDVASPSAMIGASNFFELAVAVAIAVFPMYPGVALATIVGVLVEVPVMLILVKISNRTKGWFVNNEKK
jgi:arsenite transporter